MTIRFGRYEVVGKLGEGAMAAVHLARDPVLTRFVAVKVLHRNVAAGKTALQRFFNEAKTVARLPNPHVVEVFDFGKQGRDYFLVMEFVDGRSLRGVLQPAAGPGAGLRQSARRLAGRSDRLPALPGGRGPGDGRPAWSGPPRHQAGKPDGQQPGIPENRRLRHRPSPGRQPDPHRRRPGLAPVHVPGTGARRPSPSPPKATCSPWARYSIAASRARRRSRPRRSRTCSGKSPWRRRPRPGRLRPGMDPDLARLAETLLQKDPARRGGGPRWLRSELRAWLLARGVADPMERVCHHMRELPDRPLRKTGCRPGMPTCPARSCPPRRLSRRRR